MTRCARGRKGQGRATTVTACLRLGYYRSKLLATVARLCCVVAQKDSAMGICKNGV
jgi:hypothetical protein